ncbi:Clavesin-1-like Protein [Tribolium castaneum]|uniref:Clavesin-1-like Protein n=1 Tax=Tribolium castaneum TaxID=7070 RepID=D2A6J0_TRICA|nr:Clavesin-1-like Protein [Tribolium castaneum]
MNINNTYCTTDPETRKKILDHFKINPASLKRDVDIIKEWIKQNPHFPQGTQDDDFIEKLLLKNKFSVTATKDRIEKYYTLKAIQADDMAKIRSALPKETAPMIIPLPKLTDKLERIIIMKANKNMNFMDSEAVQKSFKLSLVVSEYGLRCDFSVSHRIIQDFEGFDPEQFRQYAISLATFPKPYAGAYFARVAGVEYINVPPMVENFFKGMRNFVTDKIFRRVVHKNYESLHKNINKAYLPPEYGGELKTPLSELIDAWNKEVETNLEVLEKLVVEEVAREHLRVGKARFDDIFGVDGTFKQLEID